jgi:hypothetical protein
VSWKTVTTATPCRICGKPDWCRVSEDGLTSICRREQSHPQLGPGVSKKDKNGGQQWLYFFGPRPGAGAPTRSHGEGAKNPAAPDELHLVYVSLLRALPRSPELQKEFDRRKVPADSPLRKLCRTLPLNGRAAVVRRVVEQGLESLMARTPGFFVQEGERGKYWTIAGPPGLLIPVTDDRGRVVALLVRPFEVQGKRNYTWLSSGKKGGAKVSPPPIYVPDYWTGEHPGTARVTEGVLKAGIATSLSGILTLGLPGLHARGLVKSLKRLKIKTVRLALDADAIRNRHVGVALSTLHRRLTRAGFAVELERWDESDAKGIDDLLVTGKQPSVITGEDAAAAVAEIVSAATASTEQSKQRPADRPWPAITTNNRQYRDVEADALAALVQANNPPTVYVGNGGVLVQLCHPNPDEPPAAHVLDAAAVRPVFAAAANWYRVIPGEEGDLRVADFPPHPLLTSFPARASWPGIPLLDAVVSYPVFNDRWELAATTGYHPGARIYCHLGNLVIPGEIPEAPTAEDVEAAKRIILGEMFIDFPFADQASRAHALAMLIGPTVRYAIRGPTPLGLIDAPVEGTGKSLLAEAIMLAAVGEVPDAIAADMKDEEWNKTLLALLIEGYPIVYLDNANKKIDSGSFASTLTARFKRGRILGETKTVKAPVRVCWVMTGNNVIVSREVARRTYWVRLDARCETPAERTGFRHPSLLAWVGENRGRVIQAVLVLIRNWLARGRTPGKQTMGKFEEWAAVGGGILEAAGIEGFLANAPEFRKRSADQAGEMAEFVAAWWKARQGERVLSKDLFELVKAHDLLETALTAEKEDRRRKQLGNLLRKNRDRVIGGYRIEAPTDDDGKAEKDYAGRPYYRLDPTAKSEPGNQTVGEGCRDTADEFEMSG